MRATCVWILIGNSSKSSWTILVKIVCELGKSVKNWIKSSQFCDNLTVKSKITYRMSQLFLLLGEIISKTQENGGSRSWESLAFPRRGIVYSRDNHYSSSFVKKTLRRLCPFKTDISLVLIWYLLTMGSRMILSQKILNSVTTLLFISNLEQNYSVAVFYTRFFPHK